VIRRLAVIPPPALAPGDTVRVIAPSGPFDPAPFDAGLAILRSRYVVEVALGSDARYRYLAGTPDRRAAEFRQWLESSGLATVCARGGFGAMHLLPQLPPRISAPGLLVGFSDVTALHLALQSRGVMSLHGPVITQLGRQPPHSVERLFQLMERAEPAAPLGGTSTFVEGVAEGRLLGGNLSLVASLAGTPYLPDLRGAVLLLEDVGERPYRLDRMWTQLKLAGVLDAVSGIALGQFTGCEEKDATWSSEDVLRELAQALGKPCLAGLPIGHGEVNLAVPLGVRVRLDAGARTLSFLEPGVSPRRSAS
jgi:muramoyltetrapeptide carboxypeptidase